MKLDSATILRMLAKYKDLRTKRVHTPKEMDHTIRLRQAIYCDELTYMDPSGIVDEFDQGAAIYNAYLHNRAVCTFRIIDSYKVTPEVFEYYSYLKDLFPVQTRFFEVGRFMVIPELRGKGITIPIFKEIFQRALRLNVNGIVLTCVEALIPYYRKLGFTLLPAPAITHKFLSYPHYAMVLYFEQEKLWIEQIKRLLRGEGEPA